MIQIQFQAQIQILSIDNGTKYFNNTLETIYKNMR